MKEEVLKKIEEVLYEYKRKKKEKTKHELMIKTLNELDPYLSIPCYIEKNKEKFLKCCTLHTDTFGMVLAKLISSIENEKYIYQTAIHCTNMKIPTGYFKMQEFVKIVVVYNKSLDLYRDIDTKDEWKNIISTMINNGDIILLDTSFYSDNENNYVRVYEELSADSAPNFKGIESEKFNYVKDFINIVINYRYENNLLEISEEQLMMLVKNFIINNKDTIINKRSEVLKKSLLKTNETN